MAQCNDEVDELTRMGLQRTSVAMVPTGVDVERFDPDGEAAPRDRRARILSVGGLSPGHGQDDLIRAMRLVGDAELVIAGGPPADQLATHAEARRLRELAERTGVADQVTLVGAVPHDQLATWYRSADVVACTPHYSCPGRVSLEAMACGVPVVGYAMGGIADAVVDEVTGRLVPPGDVRTLGMTLRRLLADNAGRFAYGHAAVDRVRCSYTWERTAGALERLYERVVGRRTPVEVPDVVPVDVDADQLVEDDAATVAEADTDAPVRGTTAGPVGVSTARADARRAQARGTAPTMARSRGRVTAWWCWGAAYRVSPITEARVIRKPTRGQPLPARPDLVVEQQQPDDRGGHRTGGVHRGDGGRRGAPLHRQPEQQLTHQRVGDQQIEQRVADERLGRRRRGQRSGGHRGGGEGHPGQ